MTRRGTLPTAATPALGDIDAELMGRSLERFIRGPSGDGSDGAWSIIEPGNTLEWTWHLTALCIHLEAVSRGEIRNLLITVPPRTLKSVIVSALWPAWEWTHRPSTRWMFGSYAEAFATRDAVKARDIIRSEWYQRHWPGVVLKSDSDRKSDYRTDAGGFRYSFGVSGAATGEGADIIVADDPLNALEVYSAAKRREANRWWSEVMPSRMNDRRTGRRVVVQQRLHQEDVASLCIAAGYVHLNLPMEYDPARHCQTRWTARDGAERTWSDPRTVAGESLDPARFPADVIAELRDVKRGGLAAHAYAAQYQQDPAPIDENSIFPPSGWRRWRHLPVDAHGVPLAPDLALTSWDMTFEGKTRQGKASDPGQPDMVVGWLLYVYGADWYVIDETRGQWGYTATKRQLLAFLRRCGAQVVSDDECEACAHTLTGCTCTPVWPHAPTRHIIERKANGHAILNELAAAVPGLVKWEPKAGTGDKIARAWAVQPSHEAGQLWLPEDADWTDGEDGAIMELARFPRHRWDDRVDVLTQAKLATVKRRQWRAA